MRRILTLVVLLVLLFPLLACGDATVDESQTVDRGGLTYEVNSQTPFTGYTITKFENGQIRQKIQYKDGKKDGPWVRYHKNGQLLSKETYKDGEKIK